MLTINMEFRKGILFVRLKGVLDKTTSKVLQKEMDKMIKDKGIKYFTFNLEELDVVTKEGIALIRNNYQEIISVNGQMVLCGIHNKGWENIFDDVYQSSNELGVFQMIHV